MATLGRPTTALVRIDLRLSKYEVSSHVLVKMALVGLSCALASEGREFNIHCNTVAPLASSRLIESTLPPEMVKALTPELVVPVVLHLCHRHCDDSGAIVETGGGYVTRVRYELSEALSIESSVSTKFVSEHLSAVDDFQGQVLSSQRQVSDRRSSQVQPMHATTTSAPLSFGGQVVVITEASTQCGREYAVEFARLGAAVVANSPKRSVIDELCGRIRAAGGRAHATYESVVDGDRIIASAVAAFGRVDVLVNNAEQADFVPFEELSDHDWDVMYRINLYGTFKTCRAAWEPMLKQKSGRIINTSSLLALSPNSRVPSNAFSAMKAGVWGLTLTLALEGASRNILVNCVAPVDEPSSHSMAALVASLAHPSASLTASVLVIGAGSIAKIRSRRSCGMHFRPPSSISVEGVRDLWNRIGDFSVPGTSTPANATEATLPIYENVSAPSGAIDDAPVADSGRTTEGIPEVKQASEAGNTPSSGFRLAEAYAAEFPTTSEEHKERDVILYALSIGAKREDLHLIYENHEQFMAFPFYGLILGSSAAFSNPYSQFMPEYNPVRDLERYIGGL